MSNVIGLQARVDDIRDVGIFSTYQRKIIGTEQNASVLEANGAVYAENSLQWRPDVRTVIGLREDRRPGCHKLKARYRYIASQGVKVQSFVCGHLLGELPHSVCPFKSTSSGPFKRHR